MQPTSFIIEGVDRLGKGTLIENMQQTYGFFNVIHYQKPKLLRAYAKPQDWDGMSQAEEYQRASFATGFKLLVSEEPFIFDRFHLGETVYANRYRGYNGDYVMEMEKKSVNGWYREAAHENVNKAYPAKLVLLTTSDFSFINDDGFSFDFDKKEEEQDGFIKAFNKSLLPKVMIDVSNGKGGYKHPLEILVEAIK